MKKAKEEWIHDIVLWPQKVTGSLEVTVTHFMTSKISMTICCRIDLVYDLKGHRVVRGHCDLPYGPKGHCDLCGRFDIVHDPKRLQCH